ncbi:MAG: hypothetical protein B9S33_04415 [Pedosphaera sp. Tous-C6FEB]|nr:MAG: hypothetical protein B9S33_04415 [Pedosphaera sp. Tous-C6FEB]
MKYFLFNPASQATTGPFELDEIEAKLQAGEFPADTLAIADIDESLGQVRSTPAEDWMPVQAIPGLGHERPANLPLHNASSPEPTPAAGTVNQTSSQANRPVSVLIFIGCVIGGLIAQFGSFVMVCGFTAAFFGFKKSGNDVAIVFAVLLCLGWMALAIPLARSPGKSGFAFGILLGVGLTGLLTANCASW